MRFHSFKRFVKHGINREDIYHKIVQKFVPKKFREVPKLTRKSDAYQTKTI